MKDGLENRRDETDGITRGDLLKRAAAASGLLLGGHAAAGRRGRAPQPRRASAARARSRA